MPNHNSQWRRSPGTHIRPHKWGLNRKAQAALLRVRIRPKCPKDNLREPT